MIEMTWANGAAWITQANHPFRHILGDNTAGTDYRMRSDAYAWHHKGPCAHKDMGTNHDLSRHQR